jgi:hypothetical protein
MLKSKHMREKKSALYAGKLRENESENVEIR